MRAEVITAGSELLFGGAANTNLPELCSRLEETGVEVAYATTVGDDERAIARVISTALERVEVVLITGGLGPTHDDVTREAIAAATSRPLELREELVGRLEEFFASRGRTMSELNRRQAFLPKGALSIDNPLGTAPGIFLAHLGKTIFALPGVPAEMRAMLEAKVLPHLSRGTGGKVIATRSLNVWGITESDLAGRIASTIETWGSAITILAAAGEIAIRIRQPASDLEEALALIAPAEAEIREALGEKVYGTDDDTLEGVVSTLLKSRGSTISVAESFTGGEVTSRLVSVPGASTCLRVGLVTYALETKTSELGVSPDILEKHGAVSEETAQAMAEGVRERTGSTFGLSTTGEAGPLPGEEPVGTMFIGLAREGGSMAKRFAVPGTRETVRAWGAGAALDVMRLWLLEERSS